MSSPIQDGDPISRLLGAPAYGKTAPAPKGIRSNRNNDGRAFQKEIEQTCGAYNSRRIAAVKKVDPPTRIIGPGKIIFLPNPFLDFAGTWTARYGRALFFEAKSTAVPKLKLGSGGVTDTQIAALNAWRVAGAASFVLWQWHGECVLITPEVIRATIGTGTKHLAWSQGAAVPRGVGTVIWDFIPVLEACLFPAPQRAPRPEVVEGGGQGLPTVTPPNGPGNGSIP